MAKNNLGGMKARRITGDVITYIFLAAMCVIWLLPFFWVIMQSLRDGKGHAMDHDAIMAKYGEKMRMVERIPEVLSGAMGNQMYVATFPTREEMDAFYVDAVACN